MDNLPLHSMLASPNASSLTDEWSISTICGNAALGRLGILHQDKNCEEQVASHDPTLLTTKGMLSLDVA